MMDFYPDKNVRYRVGEGLDPPLHYGNLPVMGLFCMRIVGLDCRFRFAETYSSHQCLHWWQQMSTGHLHLGEFESGTTPIQKGRLLPPPFVLMRIVGLEPTRVKHRNLRVMSP